MIKTYLKLGDRGLEIEFVADFTEYKYLSMYADGLEPQIEQLLETATDKDMFCLQGITLIEEEWEGFELSDDTMEDLYGDLQTVFDKYHSFYQA